MPNMNLLYCHVFYCLKPATYSATLCDQADILLCDRHEHELTALMNLVNFLLDDMSLSMLPYDVESIPPE